MIQLDDVAKLQRVEPFLYVFQGVGSFRVNSLVLEDVDGLYVIDTQLEDQNNYQFIQQILDQFPDKPIKQLIISHYHLDHYIGVPLLQEKFGRFPVIGSKDSVMHMNMCTPVIWPAYQRESQTHTVAINDLVYPTQEIHSPYVIEFNQRSVTLWPIGANESWSSLIGVFHDTKTLFISDLFFEGIFIDPKIGGTILGWQQEINALTSIDFKTVIAGHGNKLYTRNDIMTFINDLNDFIQEAQVLIANHYTLQDFMVYHFKSALVIFDPAYSLQNIYSELKQQKQ
ncbi:MBL fold metallo-hydrolase [Herpetosiphon gulosus]|uniref:Metallo-beta-lactamase domain-containing protein n=1 Tax=Herpetosiphon gulosus TaxID=1973496 RepID=A0ABP9X9F0_9CHLR